MLTLKDQRPAMHKKSEKNLEIFRSFGLRLPRPRAAQRELRNVTRRRWGRDTIKKWTIWKNRAEKYFLQTSKIENFRKINIFEREKRGWFFDFFRKFPISILFEKCFSSKKKFSRQKNTLCYIFIVSRPQSLRVTSRNSLWAARERGIHPPNFGKSRKSTKWVFFIGVW